MEDQLIDRTESLQIANHLFVGSRVEIHSQELKDSVVYLFDHDERLGAGTKGLVIAGHSPWILWLWK